jgi:hypothetical protein
MSVFSDNEWEFATEFRPFNDAIDTVLVAKAVLKFNSTREGVNTRQTDAYRQGVEIRDYRELYGSTQPKLWSGNINHYTRTNPIGQARSWVELENSLIWEELPEFNPVTYLQSGDSYPAPIYFNDGPQSEEEAIIEPFTIPYRKDHSGPYFPRQIHGNLEDGNNFETLDRRTNRIEQFIDYQDPSQVRFFLDEGQDNFGGIRIEGFVGYQETLLRPWDETKDEEIVKQVNTTDPDFIAVLNRLDLDLSEDIRQKFTVKSSTAGNVIDSGNARYGTDSVAYIGLLRG